MGLIDGFEHIVREGEPLAPYTWLRLGGPADYFAEPTAVDELTELIRRFRENDQPVRLLGGGSNLLIPDDGVRGLVIHLSAPAFGEITVNGQQITAGGGAKLSHLVSTSVREGLAGLEELVGIPGTVGGALHGNAGGHSGEIGQWTRGATVVTRTGEVITRGQDDLHFAYRQSSLDELVILNAQFELEEEDPKQLNLRLQKRWIVKKAGQPASDQNCGCIFKDSGGMNPSDLIDQAGLKGTSLGEAAVSDRDANFIVVGADATTKDVTRLIELIKAQVSERVGVELESQIEVW